MIDVVRVKILLGLNSNKHDGYIEEMIPILVDYAKEYCNNPFTRDGEEVLPNPLALFVAKAIQFNMNPTGVSGRSMGGASYSYETDFPDSILRMLRPYRKVRFK